MTNKEAIYLLRNTAWLAPSLEPIDEAIEMACDALDKMDYINSQLGKADQSEPKTEICFICEYYEPKGYCNLNKCVVSPNQQSCSKYAEIKPYEYEIKGKSYKRVYGAKAVVNDSQELVKDLVKDELNLFDLMDRFETLCNDIKMQLRQSSAEIASAVRERRNETQTEGTGSPIGDYRDGVGAWQTDCAWKGVIE